MIFNSVLNSLSKIPFFQRTLTLSRTFSLFIHNLFNIFEYFFTRTSAKIWIPPKKKTKRWKETHGVLCKRGIFQSPESIHLNLFILAKFTYNNDYIKSWFSTQFSPTRRGKRQMGMKQCVQGCDTTAAEEIKREIVLIRMEQETAMFNEVLIYIFIEKKSKGNHWKNSAFDWLINNQSPLKIHFIGRGATNRKLSLIPFQWQLKYCRCNITSNKHKSVTSILCKCHSRPRFYE